MPRLRKSLGQHHLRDGNRCRPLLDFLAPERQRVLEIGIGGGALTRELLRAGACVLGIEVDLAWAFRTGAPSSGGLAIADALDIDIGRLSAPTLVTGNLPYNISTVLLRRLLPHWERVPKAGFLVQLEVARRLVAGPREPGYGGLSVITAARARAQILGRVGPEAFRPPPKVDSAFVGLELHEPPLPESEMEAFERTVRLGFGQKRKTLRNALSAGWGREEASAVLLELGFGPRLRAEEMGLPQWLKLHAERSRMLGLKGS